MSAASKCCSSATTSRCAFHVEPFTPGEKLTNQFGDKMFQVIFDFNIQSTSVGAELTHATAITPKTYVGTLMTPLIRRGLPKQSKDAMHALKLILDPESS